MTLAGRAVTLERTGLIERLEAHHGPVLLRAPSGFGKTTVLEQWIERNVHPIFRLELGASYNDPAALKNAVLNGLSLQGDIDDLNVPGTVVLDDFHALDDPDCHEWLNRLVARGPGGLRIVISGRQSPSLDLARLRARGDLLEIGAADLAFTRSETAAFLISSDIEVSDEAIDHLQETTDGWPVGLAIAARVVRGSLDHEFAVKEFAADNRELSDFLMSEVVTPMTADQRDFVASTSILDRLTAPLCDVVHGGSDAVRMLAALDAYDLVIPLDDRSQWYRYPRLLGDSLRHQALLAGDSQVELHERAAEWYSSQTLVEDAVRHFLAAGRVETAVDTLVGAYPAEVESGRVLEVLRCLEMMPRLVVTSSPQLSVIEAWVMSILQRPADAQAALENAQRTAYRGPLPDGTNSVDASSAFIEAAFPNGDVSRLVDAARRVYELEGSPGSQLEHLAHVLYGVNLYFAGEPDQAIPLLERGAALSRVTERWGNESGASSVRAWIAIDRGDEDSAIEWANRAVTVAAAARMTEAPYGGYADATLAAAIAAQGQIEEAIRRFGPALERMRAGVEPLILAQVLAARGRLSLDSGDFARASADHGEAQSILSEFTDPGMLRGRLDSLGTDIRLAEGNALSVRELEILHLLNRDLTKRQIADTLYVSYNTVHTHVKSIYRKIGAHTRNEVLLRAGQIGILETLRDVADH